MDCRRRGASSQRYFGRIMSSTALAVSQGNWEWPCRYCCLACLLDMWQWLGDFDFRKKTTVTTRTTCPLRLSQGDVLSPNIFAVWATILISSSKKVFRCSPYMRTTKRYAVPCGYAIDRRGHLRQSARGIVQHAAKYLAT